MLYALKELCVTLVIGNDVFNYTEGGRVSGDSEGTLVFCICVVHTLTKRPCKMKDGDGLSRNGYTFEGFFEFLNRVRVYRRIEFNLIQLPFNLCCDLMLRGIGCDLGTFFRIIAEQFE